MACRTWEQYERYILQQWPLTLREAQIALECIKGKKNKEIASLLGIGAETVNKTLDHVYRATGVNGRDQLVAKLLIADIDSTPLQQSLTLAGEGAALVGAGFLSTLYASRSERKRPRSVRSASLTSKGEFGRSEPVEATRANSEVKSPERLAIAADSDPSKSFGATENISPGSAEELPWIIASNSPMETVVVES